MAFYKVTSTIHMTTHFVVSVSQRRSEEPSKKIKLTVCSVNLHRGWDEDNFQACNLFLVTFSILSSCMSPRSLEIPAIQMLAKQASLL